LLSTPLCPNSRAVVAHNVTLSQGIKMHSRIAIHEVSFPDSMDIDAVLEWASTHDIRAVGLFSLRRKSGWQEAITGATRRRASVAYLCHASMFVLDDPASWDASTRALMATIDAAAAMGAPIVYATTGTAGRLDFDEAVAALCRAVVPAREHAVSRGVKLLTETANPLFGFTHFLHTFQDTVEVASAAGLRVCLDLHATWHERGIRRKISSAAKEIDLVQVSDHVPRNMTLTRDVVGTGIIPIEGLLGALFEAGYTGMVDLELFGRPPQTALDDIVRSAERLSGILTRLGV
jgi:sugar phosphate isomerase/epimerase